jgi:hypothetical protein
MSRTGKGINTERISTPSADGDIIYLGCLELAPVWDDVEVNAITSSVQEDSANEQNDDNHVGESCRKVDNLE